MGVNVTNPAYISSNSLVIFLIPSQRTQIKDKLKLSNENDLFTQDNLPYKNE